MMKLNKERIEEFKELIPQLKKKYEAISNKIESLDSELHELWVIIEEFEDIMKIAQNQDQVTKMEATKEKNLNEFFGDEENPRQSIKELLFTNMHTFNLTSVFLEETGSVDLGTDPLPIDSAFEESIMSKDRFMGLVVPSEKIKSKRPAINHLNLDMLEQAISIWKKAGIPLHSSFLRIYEGNSPVSLTHPDVPVLLFLAPTMKEEVEGDDFDEDDDNDWFDDDDNWDD